MTSMHNLNGLSLMKTVNLRESCAKDETFAFSSFASSRRKEVPFEPDKTPVPADLYFSGGR